MAATPPPVPPPPTSSPPPVAADPRPVFVPARPGVGFIIGLVGSALAGIAGLLLVVFSSVSTTGSVAPVVIGIILALIPLPLLIGAVLAMDRLEPEPLPELAFAFLWGAGTATFFAAIANTLGGQLLAAPLLGAEAGFYATITIIAPITEETLKGLVLVGFLIYRRHHVDSLTDGIIYASMVALGFATTENVTYYVQAFLEAGGSDVAATFIMRGLFSPLAHPLFTSMTGIGVAYAAMRRGGWWAPVVGWLGAMLLHGLWNGLSGIGVLTGDPGTSVLGLLTAYGVLFVVLVIVIIVLVRDRRHLVGLIQHHLPAYVEGGAVTVHDIPMLSSLGARRQARKLVRQQLGRPGAKAVLAFQHAATDLVLLHRRVTAQTTAAGDADAERRHLLGQMAAARAVFAPALETPALQ